MEILFCITDFGISIMTTVSGTNIKEISEIIDTVIENKVDIFAFARYCPTSFEKSILIFCDIQKSLCLFYPIISTLTLTCEI